MADPAHEATDEAIRATERRLADEYDEARKVAEKRAGELARGYQRELAAWKRDVAEGRRTEEEFKAWREREAAVGRWWRELADRLGRDYAEADARARGEIDDATPAVYAENVNYATYDVEAAGNVDTSFSLYDEDTVRQLASEGANPLPATGVDAAKDVAWNTRHVSSAVIQSVLLGEDVPKLAKRLQSVADMDQRAATRAARTAFTSAECAGRAEGYQRAVDMGIPLTIQWMATHDSRTRKSHRELDGETIEPGEKFSNGLRYPGDTDGPASEVYNCRCTTGAASVFGVDLTDAKGMPARRKADDPVGYAAWKAGHGAGDKRTHASGRSVSAFLSLPSVRERMQKSGMTEADVRDGLRREMRAQGHKDLRSFTGLSKSQQQEAFRAAMGAEHGITSKRNANEAGKVDVGYVGSKAYGRKFMGLTGNGAVDRSIASECRRMLVHRTGTDTEDLSLVDGRTGKVVARSAGGDGALQTRYTNEVRGAIESHPAGSLISVHNHPTNVPPTGSDFGSLMAHGYAGGVVALHNGDAYLYEVVKSDFSGVYFDKKVASAMASGKAEEDAILGVMRQLERRGSIRWRKV